MNVVVGLGNPGRRYERTRHSAGFTALNIFAEKHGFPVFVLHEKTASLVSEGILGKKKVLLAKPQTFMNNSGKAVKLLLTTNNILPTNLIVVHDDIDLPLGSIKISMGSRSAGHKGIDSIINDLGTKDFARVRIGVHPEKGKPHDVENFVLKNFMKEESHDIQQATESAVTAIETILTHDIEKARNEINKKAEKESPSQPELLS